MANVKLIFHGTEDSKTDEIGLRCYANTFDEISIILKNYNCNHDYDMQSISLDRDTAIKLHRELKKQISFLEVKEGGEYGKAN